MLTISHNELYLSKFSPPTFILKASTLLSDALLLLLILIENTRMVMNGAKIQPWLIGLMAVCVLLVLGFLLYDELANEHPLLTREVTIPDTTDSLWRAIDKENAELKEVTQTLSAPDVYLHASFLLTYIKALSERTANQSATEINSLNHEIAQIQQQLERLKKDTDAHNKTAISQDYTELQNQLENLRKHFADS